MGMIQPGTWLVFSMKVKNYLYIRGQKKQEISFYGEMATLRWDPDHSRWVEGFCSISYTTYLIETLSSIAIMRQHGRQTNDKCSARELHGLQVQSGKEAAFMFKQF